MLINAAKDDCQLVFDIIEKAVIENFDSKIPKEEYHQ